MTTLSAMVIRPSSVRPASGARGRVSRLTAVICSRRLRDSHRLRVDVAGEDLGGAVADRAEQGHDQHVAEVAEHQGHAQDQPGNGGKRGTVHLSHPDCGTDGAAALRPAAAPDRDLGTPARRNGGVAGGSSMSAIATSTGRGPASGASAAVISAASVGRRDSPPGTDLHPDPAVVDRHAGDRAAGQVGGDLAERAAVQRGHPRAAPDGRGDGVDVDAVNQRSPACRVQRQGHDTREGAASWSPSEGR